MNEMPDVIRRAIEAQGKVHPDEVLAAMEGGAIPSDEEEQVAREPGPRCHRCKEEVDANDPDVLAEVLGFQRRRREGGQNHVIARRPTGRVLCGDCGRKLRHGAAPADQMSMEEAARA